VVSHINALVKRALAKGHDLFDVLRAACINPVNHYRLPVGLLKQGDAADFIIADNQNDLNILQTYIGGELVAERGRALLPRVQVKAINNFNTGARKPADFRVPASNEEITIRVIEAVEGQLVTNEVSVPGKLVDGYIVSDVDNDILKIAVVNRYDPGATVATAFIKNFGLKRGALASTVAHDCHNIIAVGVDDESLAAAINRLVKEKGGIAVAENSKTVHCMPLAVAGLMSTDDGHKVAQEYARLDAKAKELGSSLRAPFMTLSFMALLVIPSLKLSDRGLFDGTNFKFTDVEA
jgi:adenine deaminase